MYANLDLNPIPHHANDKANMWEQNTRICISLPHMEE
jgi:hypothetical protein